MTIDASAGQSANPGAATSTDNDETKPRGEVGYGKPPAEHQFKKGNTANRRGRPKGSENSKTIFKRLLEERLPLTRGKRRAWKSRIELLVIAMVDAGLVGSFASMDVVVRMEEKIGTIDEKTNNNQRKVGYLLLEEAPTPEDWEAGFAKLPDFQRKLKEEREARMAEPMRKQ